MSLDTGLRRRHRCNTSRLPLTYLQFPDYLQPAADLTVTGEAPWQWCHYNFVTTKHKCTYPTTSLLLNSSKIFKSKRHPLVVFWKQLFSASVLIFALSCLLSCQGAVVYSSPSASFIPTSAAECFNYEDGDQYQEENACQCAVFQGPDIGSFYYQFEPQQLNPVNVSSSVNMFVSSNLKNSDVGQLQKRNQQKSTCIFYMFLADLNYRVQIELENLPNWLKLVPLPGKGAPATDDIANSCSNSGRAKAIMSSSFLYNIRLYTELVRPEVNAYDTFQYVLCEDDTVDGPNSEQSLIFTSLDRIVALQISRIPVGRSLASGINSNRRKSSSDKVKLGEIQGKFKFIPASGSPSTIMPTTSDLADAGTIIPIGDDESTEENSFDEGPALATGMPIITTSSQSANAEPSLKWANNGNNGMRKDDSVPTIALSLINSNNNAGNKGPAVTSTTRRPKQQSTTKPKPVADTVNKNGKKEGGTTARYLATDDVVSDQDESVWFVPDCDRNITYSGGSSSSNNNNNNVGIVSSPGYPDNYPMPGTVCKYSFSGGAHGSNVRVQITFVDFDLKTSADNRAMQPSSSLTAINKNQVVSCDQMDHIRINFPAAPAQPLKFCGKTRPYAVMSPTSSLELFFITEPMASVGLPSAVSLDQTARGYQLQYRFIQEERETSSSVSDDTPKQDSEKKESSGCEFRFHSWKATNGSFSSTNHPGFYPRNFKCAYHFIGRVNERVMLIFGFFDVRSSSPECADGDYIQIEYPSAVRTEAEGTGRQKLLLMSVEGNQIGSQQRYARYCSTRRPGSSIFSTWPHLLLTFITDGRDDGRGFDAYFQFVAADEAAVHQQQAGAQRLQSNAISNYFTPFLPISYLSIACYTVKVRLELYSL